MTPPSVTCPHCQTSFRITNAQLTVADGSVRCGSCLQVFNAMDQLERASKESVNAENPTVNPEEQTASQTSEKPVIEQQSITQLYGQAPEPDKAPDSTMQTKIVPAPLEYNDHQQQTIETLIQELDEHETEETVSIQQHRRNRVGWIVVALILSLLLVGQFTWFNRQTLSLDPALRGFYTNFCQLLPCALPPLVDIGAIRSTELMVRSHPDQQNALQVDAVIINEASHTQPFPNLQLTFTDINGNVIAHRIFTPTEYLAGELAGALEMPRAQPVRLELEILDPGEKAVNYQLRFSKNEATRTP